LCATIAAQPGRREADTNTRLITSTLVAPEAVLIIRLISFAGAAVGSGALAQNPEQPPSGKEIASEMLTKSRDLMVQTVRRKHRRSSAWRNPATTTNPHTTGHGSRRDVSACPPANPASTKSLKPST
jgi:hypothetical protein